MPLDAPGWLLPPGAPPEPQAELPTIGRGDVLARDASMAQELTSDAHPRLRDELLDQRLMRDDATRMFEAMETAAEKTKGV